MSMLSADIIEGLMSCKIVRVVMMMGSWNMRLFGLIINDLIIYKLSILGLH